MKYDVVIGLEVHVQVRTESKMFCSCPNEYGGEPNSNVCPVCLGYPGVLPVTNREMIRKSVLAGLLCNCKIENYNKFDRKSYFYPDQAKNYQISQFDQPICSGGKIRIRGTGFSGKPLEDKWIGLTRIHMEEDVAKSTHFVHCTGVDFNRAGIPLLELVSEPDMSTADETYAFLTGFKQLMQYGGISNCDMEKGQMRCDLNISLKPVGRKEFGTKIEVKNLNSFRAIHRATDHEIERQTVLLDKGETLVQETRGWNDDQGRTYLMRVKESANDYRYFPEPDLPAVTFTDEEVEEIAELMPERPHEREDRYVTDFELPEYDASVLTQEQPLADYFEICVAAGAPAKSAANWIMTELLRELGQRGLSVEESPVTPAALADLLSLVEKKTINGKIAKKVFAEMVESGKEPGVIVKEKGLVQVTDLSAIESFVDQVITENPGPVQQFKEGKTNVDKFLVGQVMKLSRGKANPQMVNEMIRKKLGGE